MAAGFSRRCSRALSSLASPGLEVVLRSRPLPGCAVADDHFHVRSAAAQPARLGSGELWCETLFLSVDPFLRCRFNESTGVDYTQPYAIGEALTSAGLGVVLGCGSGVSNVRPGDIVIEPFDSWPWAERCLVKADRVACVPAALGALLPLSSLLGACGQPGLTALCGLDHHSTPPTSRDVVLVSGAAGAVGSLVGQLAARRGATVIGVCGTDEKAAALARLGFAGAVNYRKADLAGQLDDELERLGGRRVSLYWDNVGGSVSDLAISRMQDGGRVILCGQISMYNTTEEYPPPLPPATAAFAAAHGISRERYLLLNHREHFAAALAELCRLVSAGELVATEQVFDGGVGGAGSAFVSMMAGGNLGKAVVRCAPLPTRAAAIDQLRRALPPKLRGALCERFVCAEHFAGLADGGPL